MTRIRIGLLPGLLLALALAVAACDGGGGKRGGVASLGDGKATSTTSAGGSSDPMQADLAYARCMRQHGINLPDPKITAEGIIQQELPRGVGPDDPRLSAAEHACHQYGSLPPINGPQRGGGGK
jgi:hypothetical protein